MAYKLNIDDEARAQILALPTAAVASLADAFEVLALVPERGVPFNADNPDGGVYQLMFDGAAGLITYILLSDQNRVDVLSVIWCGAG